MVAAFVLAQLAYVASAVEDLGSVSGALPFGRVLALEVANSFSALAGGSPAIFATRVRFFQQQGYDASVALSSGVVISRRQLGRQGRARSHLAALGLEHHPLRRAPGSGGARDRCGSSWPRWWWWPSCSGVVLPVPRLRRLAADKLRPRLADVWRDARAC